MDKIALLVAEARRWIDTPFLHQGRTRSGVDCVGLIIKICQATGRLPLDFERADYGRIPHRNELSTKVAQHCTRLDSPEPGCLLTMRWNKNAGHVALFTGDTIIHTSSRIGRVIEHGYRGHWPRLTDAAWRLPE